MKTIIRIEHNCGNGLWRTDDPITGIGLWRKLSFASELNDRHQDFPTPWYDGLVLSTNDYCAFKSIEQIQQWIEPEWFKEIIELGFKIWMIDVSEFMEGEFQIIFKKENIISKKDITQLFINKPKS